MLLLRQLAHKEGILSSTDAMPSHLILTNGQAGIEALERAGLSGTFLSWDDVLHDGPVPENLPLRALSGRRAAYISSCGWGDPEQVRVQFAERDRVIATAETYDEVTLCFEHDLYDQLQLLQILDILGELPTLTWLRPPTYLGHCTGEELGNAFASREGLSTQQHALAKKAWLAFTATSPEALMGIARTEPASLPDVPAAMQRLIASYPDSETGLSQTEYFILKSVREGITDAVSLFRANQQSEVAYFLGDASFWQRLADVMDPQAPLLTSAPSLRRDTITGDMTTLASARFALSPLGSAVLSGQTNWLRHRSMNKWIGGVHLKSGNYWTWNRRKNAFERMK